MAWNEPGDGNNKDKDNKDPWTGKPRASGPPDLDALIRKFRQKVDQLLKQKSSGGGNGNTPSSEQGPSLQAYGVSAGMIVGLVAVIWALWGIFIVGPAEQAVILQFGKYTTTVGPGPHWVPRLIDSVYKVNEQRISTYSYSAEMLTKDQNIVSVAVAVQYRIDNARDYLFNAVKPHESLQQATASALRQVIGRTNLDQVLTSGRELIRQQVQAQLNSTIAKYQTGLLITDIAMQPAKAPDEVKEAFDDAIKAQEDEQRFENQAQAYAMQVVPNANGQSQRLLADAKGYQQQIVLRAQAEISPFIALLPEYLKAPAVTRERMYLETMQNVLTNSSKILVDTNGNNNMLYLPLDKLVPPVKSTPAGAVVATPPATITTPAPEEATKSSTANTSTARMQGGYE